MCNLVYVRPCDNMALRVVEWLLRCSAPERGALTKEQYLPDIGGNEAGYF